MYNREQTPLSLRLFLRYFERAKTIRLSIFKKMLSRPPSA
ncbi:hypothetical protein HMPREF9554_00837 [Treponema phagedenis F0421]|nr:hypothetical protein HMPREF9554_00837 [Treponema phagedenis F0421]